VNTLITNGLSDLDIAQWSKLGGTWRNNFSAVRKKLQGADTVSANSAQQVKRISSFCAHFFGDFASDLVIVGEEVVEIRRDFCAGIAIFPERKRERNWYRATFVVKLFGSVRERDRTIGCPIKDANKTSVEGDG